MTHENVSISMILGLFLEITLGDLISGKIYEVKTILFSDIYVTLHLVKSIT